MGKIIKTLRIMPVLAVILAGSLVMGAQTTVETDPKLAAYVLQNLGSSMAWEEGRNQNVEEQNKIQDSILIKTTTLLSIKELSLATLDNVSGFGYESGLYKQMCNHCVGIATSSYKLIAALNDIRVEFTLVMEVGKLVDRAKNLTRAFSDIVTNGRVSSPMQVAGGSSDGKNFLRRIDRVTMANRIVMDLGIIRHQLEYMLMKARWLTWNSAFRQIDPTGWALMWGARSSMSNVISNWRNFKHKL